MIDFFAWEMVYPLGALVLLAALIYGFVQYRTRDRRKDPLTEEATKTLYEHPDTYDERTRDIDRRLDELDEDRKT